MNSAPTPYTLSILMHRLADPLGLRCCRPRPRRSDEGLGTLDYGLDQQLAFTDGKTASAAQTMAAPPSLKFQTVSRPQVDRK